MEIGFDNLNDHIIPMDEFPLKWRFTNPDYNVLPQIHLDQLKPLDKESSKFLWNFISNANLHADIPFKRDLFNTIAEIDNSEGNEKNIKKWLYHRGLPFEKEVYLSWQQETAMIAPWKLLIKYFDDFNYADDLTVIDQSLNWALIFFHEGTIYFGTNEKYIPVESSDDTSFLC